MSLSFSSGVVCGWTDSKDCPIKGEIEIVELLKKSGGLSIVMGGVVGLVEEWLLKETELIIGGANCVSDEVKILRDP